MRNAILILAASTFLATSHSPLETCSAQHPAVCEIRCGNAGGSGVLIAQNLELDLAIVLTAHHVVEGTPRYGRVDCFYPETGERSSGRLVTMNSELDIAAIACRANPNLLPAKIAPQRPAVGTPIVTEGFPYYVNASQRRDFAQLYGHVQAYEGHNIRTEAQPISGHSGAAMFDSQYRLCGIVDGYTGSQYDQAREKSYGPWISLDPNCPSARWLAMGWEKHAGGVASRTSRTRTANRRKLITSDSKPNRVQVAPEHLTNWSLVPSS